jgi:hypothetical protein
MAAFASRTSSICTIPQHAHHHFIDVTEFCLFCMYFIFFHSNRSAQKCDLFLFKSLNTKLQTRFPRRYRTKPNTTLESKAAFVHLTFIVHEAEHAIRVNESSAYLTLTVNNY